MFFFVFRRNSSLEPFNARWSSQRASTRQRSRRSLAIDDHPSASTSDNSAAPIAEPLLASLDPTEELPDDNPEDDAELPFSDWPIEMPEGFASLETAEFVQVAENEDESVVRLTLDYDAMSRSNQMDDFSILRLRYVCFYSASVFDTK